MDTQVVVCAKISPGDKRKYKALAALQDKTISDAIRDALEIWYLADSVKSWPEAQKKPSKEVGAS